MMSNLSPIDKDEILEVLIEQLRGEHSWIIRQVAISFADRDRGSLTDADAEELLRQRDRVEVINLLLDALEIYIVETAEMEREIVSYFLLPYRAPPFTRFRLFGDDQQRIPEVRIPEDENIEFDLSQLFSNGRKSTADNLKSIIDRVREALK